MATIGITGVGGTPQVETDMIRLMPVVCSADGMCNPGTMYVYGLTSSGSRVRGVVYADNAGEPGVKLSSSEAEITMTGVAGWRSGAITVPGGFSNGTTYWIGFHTDGNSHNYNAVAGNRYLSRDYDLGLPDPLGTGTASTRQYSAYIEYTEGGSVIPQSYYYMN